MLARFRATWPIRLAGFQSACQHARLQRGEPRPPENGVYSVPKWFQKRSTDLSPPRMSTRGRRGVTRRPLDQPDPGGGDGCRGPVVRWKWGRARSPSPRGQAAGGGDGCRQLAPIPVTRCRSESRRTSLHLPISRALTLSVCQTNGRRPPPYERRPVSQQSCRRPQESRHRS